MKIDFTGIPSPICPSCGDNRFVTWIVVEKETYDIGMYGTNGQCLVCSTRYTIGTPIDLMIDDNDKW
jgi:hypothetical protein